MFSMTKTNLRGIERDYRKWVRKYGDSALYREQPRNIRAVLLLGGIPEDYPLFVDEVSIANYASQPSVSAEKRKKCSEHIAGAGGLYFPPFLLWHPDVGIRDSDRLMTIDGHTRQHTVFHEWWKKHTVAYILEVPYGKLTTFAESVGRLGSVRIPNLPVFSEKRQLHV